MKPMAQRSVGTTFTVNGTRVGGLTSIGGVARSSETIDVTTLDSDGGYREFLAGFKSGGEVSLEGFLLHGSSGLDSGQAAMDNLFESGDNANFVITFPNNVASWRFSGIVTAFETSIALEDAISFTSQITVSGKPELRQGSGGAGGLSAAAAVAASAEEKKGKGDKS